MNLLVLVPIYMMLFAVACLCILYRDSTVLTSGPIGYLRNMLAETLSSFIPSVVKDALFTLGNYLFFQRNCFFQFLFVVLVILGHTVFLLDMLPVLSYFYPDDNHTFWPFVAVFINYLFFHLAWTSDPGEITSQNHSTYMKVYEMDNAMYVTDISCRTCKFVKPARSKHCSTCNRCVHRFDHHCIWTNNCVGVYTHRYFILYMATLILMFIQGVYVGTHCCLLYAKLWKLEKASYIAEDGSAKPVTFAVGFQHLFMQVPRLVFLILAMIVMIFLVGVFLTQHLYYILLNQTTNERYKVAWLLEVQKRVEKSQSTPVHHISSSYSPYSRGIVNNALEVFFPSYFIKKRLKSM